MSKKLLIAAVGGIVIVAALAVGLSLRKPAPKFKVGSYAENCVQFEKMWGNKKLSDLTVNEAQLLNDCHRYGY